MSCWLFECFAHLSLEKRCGHGAKQRVIEEVEKVYISRLNPEIRQVHFEHIPKWIYETDCGRIYLSGSFVKIFQDIVQKPQEERCYHEVIPDDIPIKFFMDLDANLPNPNFDPTIDYANEIAKEFIELLGLYVEETDYDVICASSQNKYSKHIIIQYLVPNKIYLKILMEDFVKMTKYPWLIDMNVYSTDKSLRVLKNVKRSDPKRVLELERPTKFPNDFFRTLVTCYRTPHQQPGSAISLINAIPIFELETADGLPGNDIWSPSDAYKGIYSNYAKFGSSYQTEEPDFNGWSDDEINHIRNGFEKYIRTICPAAQHIYMKHSKDRLLTCIHPCVYCDHIKGVHKSNGTYCNLRIPKRENCFDFNIHQKFFIHFRCSDEDCKDAPVFGKSFIGNFIMNYILDKPLPQIVN